MRRVTAATGGATSSCSVARQSQCGRRNHAGRLVTALGGRIRGVKVHVSAGSLEVDRGYAGNRRFDVITDLAGNVARDVERPQNRVDAGMRLVVDDKCQRRPIVAVEAQRR